MFEYNKSPMFKISVLVSFYINLTWARIFILEEWTSMEMSPSDWHVKKNVVHFFDWWQILGPSSLWVRIIFDLVVLGPIGKLAEEAMRRKTGITHSASALVSKVFHVWTPVLTSPSDGLCYRTITWNKPFAPLTALVMICDHIPRNLKINYK